MTNFRRLLKHASAFLRLDSCLIVRVITERKLDKFTSLIRQSVFKETVECFEILFKSREQEKGPKRQNLWLR